MSKRNPNDDHRRIVNGLRRFSNRARWRGDMKQRHRYLKLLLKFQILNFNKEG